jgi:hypothetical protein
MIAFLPPRVFSSLLLSLSLPDLIVHILQYHLKSVTLRSFDYYNPKSNQLKNHVERNCGTHYWRKQGQVHFLSFPFIS